MAGAVTIREQSVSRRYAVGDREGMSVVDASGPVVLLRVPRSPGLAEYEIRRSIAGFGAPGRHERGGRVVDD